MYVSHSELCAGFAAQGAAIADLVERIEDQSGQTRLAGWTKAVLIGHITAAVEALWRWRSAAVDDRLELDEVTYWTPVAGFAEGSSEWAVAYASRRTDQRLRDGMVEALSRAETEIAETDPSVPIVPPLGRGWIRFDRFLATRIVELTIHGLDLAAAENLQLEPAAAARSITATILDRRLEGDRPHDLTSDVAWIEAASGRVEHADPRLPVLR